MMMCPKKTNNVEYSPIKKIQLYGLILKSQIKTINYSDFWLCIGKCQIYVNTCKYDQKILKLPKMTQNHH